MDGWDIVLLVVAAYVAVTALVRLMLHRRDQVLGDLRRQVEAERRRADDDTDEPRQRSA